MAMEVIQTIDAAHEDALAGVAFNPINKQIYTCAEGDKAIKVWDLKTGQLLRTQTFHRGMVTCLAYATNAKLLFSGSIDGSIGVSTDKGNLLQVVATGWPVFSLAWSSKQRMLVAGGNSVLHIYKVDMTDALRVKHARHHAQPTTRQQQQQYPDGPAASETAARAAGLAADPPQILRRVCPAFKGWKQHQKGMSGCSKLEGVAGRQDGSLPSAVAVPAGLSSAALQGSPDPSAAQTSPTAAAAAPAAAAPPAPAPEPTGGTDGDVLPNSSSPYAESEAAVSSTGSGSRPKGKGAAGGAGNNNNNLRQREEDYFGVCHTDVVKCIVIADSGKIFTAGFDRCICLYDMDKLDKPKEAFKRVKDCGKAGLTSLAFDPHNNVLLAGSLDGILRVWSVEGRCLDKFEGLSTQPVHVAYLPHTNNWWATGRFSRVAALDPRAPALITEYVAAPNQLLEHAVQLLYAPPGSDLVIAGTTKRQLLVWQFNPHAAHRVFCGHQDWVEGVLVCKAGDNAFDQAFFTHSADGHVCCWELDAEQNCNVFKLVEDAEVVPCSVQCLLHLPDRQWVVCGCEDGTIRLHTLDGRMPPAAAASSSSSSSAGAAVRDVGGGLLPTVWTGHEGKVTGLVCLPGQLLLSCSEDRSLRVWDLNTMKQLHVELDAHDSPIQCLEYCLTRKQAATCGMGAKVKVWSLAKPTQPTLVLLLDHTDPAAKQLREQQQQQQADGAGAAAVPDGVPDVNPTGVSNMRWLIKSELAEGSLQDKKASTLPDIVADAIAHAADDVPEVTQVRWIGFKECWVTAADDELLRLWSTAGKKLAEFAYKGGSCRCLFVDESNQLLLIATADKSATVFDLSAGILPLARFQGHSDIISGIGYLSAPLDCYVTSSWDQQVRLWKRPLPTSLTGSSSSSNEGAGGGRQMAAAAADAANNKGPPASGAKGEASYLLAEDSEDGGSFVSEYEKAHPLVVPKALTQDHTLALLNAVGGSGRGGSRRVGGRQGRLAAREARFSEDGSLYGTQEPADQPGTLGAKLQELGRRLLQDINETAGKAAAGGMVPAGGILRSNSTRSVAPSSHQLLRRGGPTSSRRER